MKRMTFDFLKEVSRSEQDSFTLQMRTWDGVRSICRVGFESSWAIYIDDEADEHSICSKLAFIPGTKKEVRTSHI